MKKIHLYPQVYSHGDAYIVADADGLRALIKACEAALTEGDSALCATPADGEGYAILVKKLEAEDEQWEQIPLPYPCNGANARGGDTPIYDLIGLDKYVAHHTRIKQGLL